MAVAVVRTLPDAAALDDSVVAVRHTTIDDEDDYHMQLAADVVDDEL